MHKETHSKHHKGYPFETYYLLLWNQTFSMTSCSTASSSTLNFHCLEKAWTFRYKYLLLCFKKEMKSILFRKIRVSKWDIWHKTLHLMKNKLWCSYSPLVLIEGCHETNARWDWCHVCVCVLVRRWNSVGVIQQWINLIKKLGRMPLIV